MATTTTPIYDFVNETNTVEEIAGDQHHKDFKKKLKRMGLPKAERKVALETFKKLNPAKPDFVRWRIKGGVNVQDTTGYVTFKPNITIV